MFQNLHPRLCHRAIAADATFGLEFPLGCGIAADLRAAPAVSKGRSPATGLAYRAAAQFRAAAPSIPTTETEEIPR